MHLEFEKLLNAVRAGEAASMPFEIEDVTYLRRFSPKERLILLGGGHIAQPLCRYCADIGFAVTVVDDRPSFANQTRFPEAAEVICDAFPDAIRTLSITKRDYIATITRGHRHDADCLRTILHGEFPRYLGMIGSKRRGVELLHLLEEEGVPRSALDWIHTPIGVDINALTVEEIAISITAEIIQCRRKDTLRRSKAELLVTEDINLPLLELLANAQTTKALLLVYETSGSTPVKSGAMMAVDQSFRMVGTIGGGCSENAVLMDAYRLIGTGRSRCVVVDMSNHAEEEGMVCGGQMKVLIQDV
ncbi:XdhC/CoxI family protein [Oscillibacter sp.]|uniref:XdhC/CoxI family protein n=1 Tax=Oscillibacter sp. TaxID=1945593 RepID=UPI0028ABAA5F|nr:XdhC/CoxI family protein [Oscillibacter sp.]